MPRPIYSEEMQEIMGRIPGWIVRWGISLIFILFALLLGISYFFKYPEVITSNVVLTTLNPPAELIARSTGKIEHLLAENGKVVKKNEIIAILFNTANYHSVLDLEKFLNTPSLSAEDCIEKLFTDNQVELGELQSYYAAWEKGCKSYDHYVKTGAIPLQKKQIELQIGMLRTSLQTQNHQLGIMQKDKGYELENLKRDSTLYYANALTEVEYEQAQQKLLQKELSIASHKNTLISTQSNILNLEKQLTDLTIQYDNELNEYQLQFNEQKDQLLAQIKLWKEKYILSTPINGKITFTKYWSENQNITTGDRLATVIPDDSMRIIGRITIPSSGLAKVKEGQQVNVKLNGFPYMEYGVLKGRLSSLSAIPEEEGYMAEVIFPDGLISSYANKFRFIQQMDGTAEIVTKDARLIERFVRPIESLLKN